MLLAESTRLLSLESFNFPGERRKILNQYFITRLGLSPVKDINRVGAFFISISWELLTNPVNIDISSMEIRMKS